MDAARMMTAGAVDLGEKPSVISAIVKYHLTERGRAVVNDAMDILGGKGICLGPNNFLGRIYQQLPIAITVEGANILTRNLIVFGQGAIRCHPYVLKEMNAARAGDLKSFDAALFGHIRHVLSNETRAFLMAITGSRFVSVSSKAAPRTRRYYRQLTRISAALAYAADISMLVLGGSLKRRERISARLGDVLSMLYLASAALKRFEDEGRQESDLPLLDWSLQDALARAAEALHGVLANYPVWLVGSFLRLVTFPLGRHFAPPSDALGHEVARLLIAPSAARDRLCAGMYLPASESEPLGCLEAALEAAIRGEAVEAKIRAPQKSRNRPGPFSASDLATAAGKALLVRQPFAPTELDEVILGCAAPSVDEVNIGRVAALRMGCGQKVPGWTVMRNCASGMQALDSAIANMLSGRSKLVLAGGGDALSRVPLLYSEGMVILVSDFIVAENPLPQDGTVLSLQ